MFRSRKLSKILFSLLIGLLLIAGQSAFLLTDNAYGAPDDPEQGLSDDTILTFSSDVHNETNDISANRLADWIGMIQGKFGPIDAMGFGGDLGDAGDGYNYWRNVQAVMNAVASKGVDGVYTTGNHEFNPGDAHYNSDTHALTSATGQAVLNNYKVCAEGKQGDNYRIFCLGSTSTTQGYWVTEKEAFEGYVMQDVGKEKPTVIITHFPLHFCIGNNWGDRTTAYADLIIDFLNGAATNNTPNDPSDDRKIIFLWGHNHSEHDPYYDQIYVPGDSIEYSRGNYKQIQFYYGAAGCMSDYEYGGTGGGSASVKGKGLVLQIRADDGLGFGYFDAAGNDVTEGDNYPKILTAPKAVKGLSFDPSELTIKEGRTSKLTAVFDPIDATNKNLTWESTNESVATVTPDQTGTAAKVRGVSQGTAVIKATSEDGNFTATATVTVEAFDSEQYYVIKIGNDAMSCRPSSAVRREGDSYEYHGLESVAYSSEAAAPYYILWRLEPAEGTENGYYIRSFSGKYLSASYVFDQSINRNVGAVTVGDTKDIWIIEKDPDSWTLDGGVIKSTNASVYSSNNKDKYLAVNVGTEGNDARFITVRSTGEGCTMANPEDIEEHVHTYGTPSYEWNKTDDGYACTATAECSTCEEDIEEHIATETVDASSEITTPATCLSKGETTYTATFTKAPFAEQTKVEDIDAPGHAWNSEFTVDQAPTCTEEGTESKHCKNCEAVKDSQTVPATGHKWDAGKVTKQATSTAAGEKTYTCTVCETTKTETIPKLAPGADPNQKGSDGTAVGPGASAAAAEKALTTMKTDTDPKGAAFSKLQVRSPKQAKTSISLKWTKVSKATKYVIYGNKCGKTMKPKKLATVTGNAKTFKKVAGKKLKKGTYYKFIIVALDKNKNVVSTSKLIHVATKGGKVGNHKSVTVKKSILTKAKALKKGKSLSLKAKLVLQSKKLKAKKHVGLRYESSNKKIATVSSKGVIKAKKKGTCYVYAYAQNGVFKKIKVVVK